MTFGVFDEETRAEILYLFEQPETGQLESIIDRLAKEKPMELSANEAALLNESLQRLASRIGAMIT